MLTFRKKEIVSNLRFHLRSLEEEEQNKSGVSRRKEIIKARAEIIEIKIRKT